MLAIAVGGPSQASGSSELTAEAPSAQWSSAALAPTAPNCLSAELGETLCSEHQLSVAVAGTVDLSLDVVEGDKWDVLVYDTVVSDDTAVASGLNAGSFTAAEGGTYIVVLKPYFVVPGNAVTANAVLTPAVEAEEPVVEDAA